MTEQVLNSLKTIFHEHTMENVMLIRVTGLASETQFVKMAGAVTTSSRNDEFQKRQYHEQSFQIAINIIVENSSI